VQRSRPGRPRPLGALLGWGLLATVTTVAAFARAPASAQPGAPTQEQLQRGALIYQQQCAQCHGGDGRGGTVRGTGRPAPPLRSQGVGADSTANPVTIASVDLVLRTGRMPPVGDPFDNRLRQPTVTGADREALLAWIRSAFGLTGQIPEVRLGDPGRGLQVYGAQCAHCHGSSGGGGVAGAGAYTPPLTSYEPVVIAEAIRVGPFEMPAFSPAQVNDQEVGDIAAFLRTVEEERTTPLFRLVELNPVYAGAFVALLSVVLILSLLWIAGRPASFPDLHRDEAEP
jgi:ubiquinol-cytochrome c reductase cytochrome c subunit